MIGLHDDDTHVECVSDFCGNYRHPGAWADLFQRPDGARYLRLGGGWEFYGSNTPEVIEETDEHFAPFLKACEQDSDFDYAKTHWDGSSERKESTDAA